MSSIVVASCALKNKSLDLGMHNNISMSLVLVYKVFKMKDCNSLK